MKKTRNPFESSEFYRSRDLSPGSDGEKVPGPHEAPAAAPSGNTPREPRPAAGRGSSSFCPLRSGSASGRSPEHDPSAGKAEASRTRRPATAEPPGVTAPEEADSPREPLGSSDIPDTPRTRAVRRKSQPAPAHASPGRRHGGSRQPVKKDRARALRLGSWIFLGAALLLALIVILVLSFRKGQDVPVWEPLAPHVSDSRPGETVPQGGSHSGDEGGRAVRISGISCPFTPPAELSFGVVESLDLSGIGDTVCANAAEKGWGSLVWSSGEDGSLLFYRKNAAVLPGDKYKAQEEFMESSQPENLARTFLTDSGLYALLSREGITLSTEIHREDGALMFKSTDNGTQAEAQVRLSFLYDGSLNQARVRATHLAGSMTTTDIVPLDRAAASAVSWNSDGRTETLVTAAEIRSVSGIPFYILSCDDGSTAYALAITEKALDRNPAARSVYDSLMLTGIQEYVRSEGAGI